MNPELRRNLWLELSVNRLVGMPLALLPVMGFFAASTQQDWRGMLLISAIIAFVVLVHFVGTRNAAEAVTREVRDRTWDWQRLSSMGPWRMTWGKLAGVTAFMWYGGLICLAAIGVAALAGVRRGQLGWIVLMLVATGIAMHGLALATSLQAGRKISRIGQRMGILALIPIAITAGVAYFWADEEAATTIEWFGQRCRYLPFFALSAVALAAWGVLAAYREMCRELKVRVLPWALPSFTIFAAAYAAGFPIGASGFREAFILVGLLASVLFTDYTIFAEDTTAMSLRRVVLHLRAGAWRRAAEEVPLWAVSLAMAIAFALAAVVLLDRRMEATAPVHWIGVYPEAIALFALRDCGLLVFFVLAPKPRRVETVTLLCLFLLSWLMPGLLEGAGLKVAAGLLFPFGKLDGTQAALVLAGHVALVWGGVAWRWRARQRAFDAAQ